MNAVDFMGRESQGNEIYLNEKQIYFMFQKPLYTYVLTWKKTLAGLLGPHFH